MVDVLVADPTGIKALLNSDNFVKPARVRGHFGRVVGNDSLLVLEGQEHALHRAVVNPAFNYGNVKAMMPIFDSAGKNIVSYWIKCRESGKTTVPAGHDLGRLTFDSISKIAFGADLNTLAEENSSMAHHFQVVLGSAQPSFKSMLPFYFSLPLREHAQREESRRELEKFIVGLIRKKTEEGKKADKIDLLDRLLEVKNQTSEEAKVQLSDEHAITHLLTFAAAGHETTSASLSFTLYLLATHPEIRLRVQKEATSQLEASHGDLTFEVVEKMEYLHAVLRESLRLYPPAAINMRTPLKDDTVCGYQIPAGTNIIISSIVMHRHPQFWERPEEFWPDRWLQPGFAPSNTLYFPFGAGIHTCVGQKLAILEMRVILARILSADLDFRVPSDYRPKRKSNLTLRLDPLLILELE